MNDSSDLTDLTDLTRRRAEQMAQAMRMAPELIGRLTWSAEEIAAHRVAALRALVRVAVDRSAWHRKRLAGICPETLELADLAHLPAMTKADVMANFDEIVTDDRLRLADVEANLSGGQGDYLLDRYTAVATGGSSGRRSVTVYDWEGSAMVWLSCFRRLLRDRASDPALAGQVKLAWVAAAHPTHMSAVLGRTFQDPGLVSVRLPVTLTVEQIVAGLNEAAPQVLFGYPSILLVLAHEAAAGRLRIAPVRVMSAGEPLLPEIRAAVRAAWDVPLVNWWGATETGMLAQSCARDRLHLCEDISVVEPVDAAGRAVSPGQRAAKIYATNLFNQLLPLIRYELTDEVTVLPEPCDCGEVTACVEDVQGRLDDLFFYSGRAVHPHVFRSVLGRRPAIVEYQVHQTARGAEILLAAAEHVDVAAVRGELISALAGSGLDDPKVTVRFADRLERHTETGKLKRFVPLANR